MRTWPAIELGAVLSAVEADLLQAALLDHDVAAIDEDAARVFFHTADARDKAIPALQQQFPGVSFRPIDIPDEDWAARSQANLRAVQVGSVIVAPPWDVPA